MIPKSSPLDPLGPVPSTVPLAVIAALIPTIVCVWLFCSVWKKSTSRPAAEKSTTMQPAGEACFGGPPVAGSLHELRVV